MATRGTLQSRLQTIEQELRQIKEKSLMVGNDNFQKLCDTIDELIEKVKKDIDETKDALTETEACVEEMGRDFVKKAELQSHLDEQIKAAVEKIVNKIEDGDDRPERGLYLTGVGRLRESLVSPPDDPCDVVHTILHRIGSAAYYTKIVPILPSSKIRKDTDQAIVYFSSIYHRKYAAAELRRHFAREKLTKVSIRDLFERRDVELAKRMTRLGFQLKQDGTICRFRVSNIRGTPSFLCAGQDRKYSEMDQRTLQAKLDSMNKLVQP